MTENPTTVRYALSAAIPVPGLAGGLREVASHEFTVAPGERARAAARLPQWARDTLRRHGGPLGLYLAECVLPDAAESDDDWLSEEAIMWNDDDEMPPGLRRHPALRGPGRM